MGSRQTHTPDADSVLRAVETLRGAGFLLVAPRPLRLLSVGAAAELLSVSTTTIRQWQRAGRLPGATMLPGGDLRIPMADIEAIIAAGRLSRREAQEAA